MGLETIPARRTSTPADTDRQNLATSPRPPLPLPPLATPHRSLNAAWTLAIFLISWRFGQGEPLRPAALVLGVKRAGTVGVKIMDHIPDPVGTGDRHPQRSWPRSYPARTATPSAPAARSPPNPCPCESVPSRSCSVSSPPIRRCRGWSMPWPPIRFERLSRSGRRLRHELAEVLAFVDAESHHSARA
jgi:hypothetical protein